jgi:hypothetical protein
MANSFHPNHASSHEAKAATRAASTPGDQGRKDETGDEELLDRPVEKVSISVRAAISLYFATMSSVSFTKSGTRGCPRCNVARRGKRALWRVPPRAIGRDAVFLDPHVLHGISRVLATSAGSKITAKGSSSPPESFST